MKIPPSTSPGRPQGFALIMVLIMVGVSLLILVGAVQRSSAISKMNSRSNEYAACANAAEGAVEKAYAILAWQFQSYGVAGASNALTTIRANIPQASDFGYWTNFVFSDAAGNSNRTYVNYAYSYSGGLPSAYSGRFTANAPVYRIVSNAQVASSDSGIKGTAQEDVLLALVPLVTWAIFYNGLLEFTQCADMTVNGPVQANGSIYVGTSASLAFYSAVNTTGTLTSPTADGVGPWTSSTWNTSFGSDGYVTNAPSVAVSLNMTNSHFLIDIPPAGENSMSSTGQQRLFNQAQMLIIVTNNSALNGNPTVILTMQTGSSGAVNGSDPSKYVWTLTNASPANLSSNMPFLALTNSFYDQREGKTNIITDIDVGRFATWSATNSTVQGKLSSGAGIYPTVVYVADRRKSSTNQPGQLSVVRLNNGAQLPANNGYGFSVATQNPLYVDGNYNTQIAGYGGSSAGTTNTTYTVPAALMSDSLTILASTWTDSSSKTKTQTYSSGTSAWDATDTTVNAAIVTGTMPSTGSTATTFSGGVHNLPRLLQDWSGKNLYLNTSILRLWDSQMATNQFRNPSGFSPAPVNPYYNPPTRHYAYDLNFRNPAKVPPGIPVALVPIRFAWGTPPPNVTSYTPAHD